MIEEAAIPTPILPEPTETLSVPLNPPWHWSDVGWLVALFLLGAALLSVIYGVALQQVRGSVAPAVQVAGALSQVYLLLILGVYWFAIRRAGATWEQLGVRRPRMAWLLAVPAIFMIQLMAIAFINFAVIGFFTTGGFKNPQLDALEQALARPTATAVQSAAADSTAQSAKAKETTTVDSGNNAAAAAQMERLSRTVKLTRGDMLWLILAIGIITPFSEELLFRGMIYPLQRRKQRLAVAILLNGFLFALAHMIPVLMPALFVIGVILAWVRERSGSIWPAFLLHVMQNSAAIYAIYSVVNHSTGT